MLNTIFTIALAALAMADTLRGPMARTLSQMAMERGFETSEAAYQAWCAEVGRDGTREITAFDYSTVRDWLRSLPRVGSSARSAAQKRRTHELPASYDAEAAVTALAMNRRERAFGQTPEGPPANPVAEPPTNEPGTLTLHAQVLFNLGIITSHDATAILKTKRAPNSLADVVEGWTVRFAEERIVLVDMSERQLLRTPLPLMPEGTDRDTVLRAAAVMFLEGGYEEVVERLSKAVMQFNPTASFSDKWEDWRARRMAGILALGGVPTLYHPVPMFKPIAPAQETML